MSYFLAFAGFAALIILHEFGHFAAAKAVGMRVERFSLFFGPMLFKVRRGETEYGIGPIPLGGYVKISGMNPREELPDEMVPRAYWAQPVWKRIVVIAAGPAMNVLVAFIILWAVYLSAGKVGDNANAIALVTRGAPAAGVLALGDIVQSVDGDRNYKDYPRLIARHACAQTPPVNGCRASTPARLVVQRGNRTVDLLLYPRYEASPAPGRPRIGVAFTDPTLSQGVFSAAGSSIGEMVHVTSLTLSTFGQLFVSSKARKQVDGVVGAYTITSQAFSFSATEAAGILALISLSLAIVNLLPFLPLDGGHIFWALVERLRGRAVPVSVMEQASVVGIALVGFLFLIGLQNSIHTLTHGGYHIP